MSYGDQHSEPLPLPTGRWFVMHAALWLTDLVIVILAAVPFVAPSPFDPSWGAASASVFGVPAGPLVYVVGLGLAIGGRLWMERINRADREPEAHDAFWWSRT